MKHRPTGSSAEILKLCDDSEGIVGLILSETTEEAEMIETNVT
jgi:hypothetical protein